MSTTAKPDPPPMPGGAVMLGPAPDEEPELDWQTGTAIDEFTPIYRNMALTTKLHGPIPPHEVDLMDLTTCALLLGVGTDPVADDMRALAELGRRRASGEQVSWEDL